MSNKESKYQDLALFPQRSYVFNICKIGTKEACGDLTIINGAPCCKQNSEHNNTSCLQARSKCDGIIGQIIKNRNLLIGDKVDYENKNDQLENLALIRVKHGLGIKEKFKIEAGLIAISIPREKVVIKLTKEAISIFDKDKPDKKITISARST